MNLTKRIETGVRGAPRWRRVAGILQTKLKQTPRVSAGGAPVVVPGFDPCNPAPLALQNGVPVGQLTYIPAPPGNEEKRE